MAQTTPGFVISAASHTAAAFRQAASGYADVSGGFLGNYDYQAFAQSTPNMSVAVRPGRAWVPGTEVSPPSGFTSFTTQASYWALNDGYPSVVVPTSDPSNPRIDVVYVGAQDAFYSGVANQMTLGLVSGTPSGTPVAPSVPVNSLAIARIAVGAAVTAITNANITDVRVQAQPGVQSFRCRQELRSRVNTGAPVSVAPGATATILNTTITTTKPSTVWVLGLQNFKYAASAALNLNTYINGVQVDTRRFHDQGVTGIWPMAYDGQMFIPVPQTVTVQVQLANDPLSGGAITAYDNSYTIREMM